MPLPDNFALLALSPTIRENDGFLYLQTGQAGYIDLMVQSATGLPVNIMKVGSGVPVSKYIYVNENYHFIGFAINTDNQVIGIAEDENENEIFIEL
jgi:hypothetical protein